MRDDCEINDMTQDAQTYKEDGPSLDGANNLRDNQIGLKIMGEYTEEEIMSLAKEKSPQARNELMHVITDLIEENLSTKEKDLVGDILINLIRQAVKDMREAVSAKLAHRKDIPEKIILHLAHDEIDVARHVLLNSPLLSDDDLLYVIKTKTSHYWNCIASRRELSAPIIDALVDQRQVETSRRLAQNNHINLTDHAFKVLGEMVMDERDLAEPILTRNDVPVSLAEKLYEHVGQAMQSYIKQKFGDEMAIQASRDVTAELIHTARNRFTPNDAIRADVKERKREGKLTLRETIDTLRRGQIPTFIAMFSEYMDLSERTIEDILRENNGRSLAVLCRYQNMSRADFVAIYLMLHKIRSFDNIVPQKELQKAMKYFDKIDNKTAKTLMQDIKTKDRH